jgi:DNA-binding SARP family transcriptional activator/tetratricopeptide (TPR) repeat protein
VSEKRYDSSTLPTLGTSLRNRNSPRYRIGVVTRVNVQLLGPVRVLVDGAPLAVDTRKAIALLAYVAATGRPASRDRLAALLWPDSDETDARAALRRTLSVLKAGLGGAGLQIDRAIVALRPVELDVDLWRFRDELARVRGHAHEPDTACPSCLEALDDALTLDRGEFMSGFSLRDSDAFDEWQLAETEAHRRELCGALERSARGRAAAGALDAALVAGRRWLELEPLHEPAHRLLMESLARTGEAAAAIRQYRDCVRILDAELGVAPLAETTALYEAIRAGQLVLTPRPAGVADASPPPQPDLPPLIGRDRELRALLAAHRSIGPDGRLLVIEGEPGIGKTRLAAAFAVAVRATGATVLEARAYAGEATIPFASVVELLRAALDRPAAVEGVRRVRPDLLDEVSRLVPLPGRPASPVHDRETADPFGRARLLDALTEVLTAAVEGPLPGVIWIDDLDWADGSTVEVIAYLARRLRDRPVALVVTWRPEDLAESIRVAVSGAAERERLVEIVELGRLTRTDVAALVEARLGPAGDDAAIDALFADSEGLPLFLAEALAGPTTANGGPAAGGVHALLRARIASIGELARQLIATAAVIGRSFDLGTVRAASGRSEDEAVSGIEELLRRGLIREVDASSGADLRYDFTHGRLRDAAYEGLSMARRRLLHRRVAEALAGQSDAAGVDGIRWSLIASHEMLAGRSAAAAEAHERAAKHARAVFANREAADHLEAALALGHPAGADLHEALGEVLILLGDYAGAIGHLESAAAAAGPDTIGRIEHRLGLAHARRGDGERADSHLITALDLAGEGVAAGPLRAVILVERSGLALRAGHEAAAGALAREALVLAEGADDAAATAMAEDLLGILARRSGQLALAREHLERALTAAADAPDPGGRIAALNTLALVCADEGDRERALALTAEALGLCRTRGDRHREAALENNLADLLHAMGRDDAAMEHLKRAVAIFAEVGGRPGELEPEIWKLVEW